MKTFIVTSALLIIAVFSFAFWSIYTKDDREKEVYEAWNRANPDAIIDYEDWKKLKRSYLLPGQQHPKY